MKKLMIPNIKNKIYAIRGKQVILDSDLAKLYQVKATRLREQVKRNKDRFPKRFMFQITKEEAEILVSQNAIPSKQHLGGFLPYVFTEQGVSMLSAILRSKTAIEVSIRIIDAFVEMKRFLSKNAQVFNRLDYIERKQLAFEIKTEKNFEKIFNALQTEKPKQGIFYEGQIFEAHKFVCDLIKTAKREIVLIDNYVDENTLLLFSERNKKVKVIILTKNLSKKLNLDLEKFNSQFEPIVIKKFNNSHDRFLIIDEKEIYHIGASLKDLGKKWFAFSKFETEAVKMLSKLN